MILEPKPGDIVDIYCTHYDELVGVLLFIRDRQPDRPDLALAWCLYNDKVDSLLDSEFRHLHPGQPVNIHRVKFVARMDAKQMGHAHYYKIRKT